jgi:hypothetical protein
MALTPRVLFILTGAAKNIDTAAIGVVTRSAQTLFRRLKKCCFTFVP